MQFVARLGRRGRAGLAVVGGLTLGSQYVTWKQAQNNKLKMSKDRVLHLDMTMQITEDAPTPWEEIVNSKRPPMSLRQVVDALEWASVDPHVKGVVCTLAGESQTTIATTQEIRNAILAFRAKQTAPARPTVFSADTFGESGQGTAQYYLASAFDKIYLQPSGLVGLIGMHSETFFLKNMLAKIGVYPQFLAYFEYKNAANMFTQDGFTEQHREQTHRLMDSLFRQIISGIATSRSLSESKVRSLMDESPLHAQEALKHSLVDGLQYHDRVLVDLGVSKECVVQDMHRYYKEAEKVKNKEKDGGKSFYDKAMEAAQKGANAKHEDVVALVTATGNVVRGRGQRKDMGAAKVVEAVRAAVKDENVKSIVVRVDTRGGSAIASDTIRRELELARESGKPVVVSMGSVAASGGYYIATGADKIVAQPGTITGSIGVVLGKFTLSELYGKLGVSVGEMQMGKQASTMSSNTPWNESQLETAQQLGLNFYNDFVGHVAKARNMTVQQVDSMARGRVWTGEQARDLGLVDVLGGLKEAHAVAAELAPGVPKDKLPRLVSYPKKKKPIQELAELLSGKSEDSGKALASIASLGTDDLWEIVSLLSEVGAAVRAVKAEASGHAEFRYQGGDVRSG
mmetsp:Transcript_20172/g.39156  ORF Transcript_20172/g.39156 Transcript_20172/m.39156 type:complete len:627 (+) Transcript_20172:68-1948(+)